jgi:hypothetical protein
MVDVRRRADVIVAADCLFFEHYHEHLMSTCWGALKRGQPPPAPLHAAAAPACVYGSAAEALLAPHECTGATIPQVWMVAPERAGSRGRFAALAREWAVPPSSPAASSPPPAWSVHDVNEYDPVVLAAHATALQGGGLYDADLHFPKLLVLCPREWGGLVAARLASVRGASSTQEVNGVSACRVNA